MLPDTKKRNLIFEWETIFCLILSIREFLDRFSWKPSNKFNVDSPSLNLADTGEQTGRQKDMMKAMDDFCCCESVPNYCRIRTLSKLQKWTISSSVPRKLSYRKQLSISHWSSWRFQRSSSYAHYQISALTCTLTYLSSNRLLFIFLIPFIAQF
jgi:hypothetical protein